MIEIIPNFHPLFVHFPIAFVTAALFFYAAGKFFKENRMAEQCLIFARWMLWATVIFAVVASMFGWIAYNSVDHDEAGHQAMMLHRKWALVTVGVLLLIAAADGWFQRFMVAPYGFLAMLMVVWLLVISTAWLGGEVVYRHGLGVMSLPEKEGGLPHEHGMDHNVTSPNEEHANMYEKNVSHKEMTRKRIEHAHAPGTAPHQD